MAATPITPAQTDALAQLAEIPEVGSEEHAEAIAHREANPASENHAFVPALPDPHAAWWMAERLPAEAVSMADRLPPQRKEVLGFVSAPDVAIHHMPVVVWWSDRLADGEIVWWAGLPGSYLDLRRWKWIVTHWLPLAAATRAALATGGGRHG